MYCSVVKRFDFGPKVIFFMKNFNNYIRNLNVSFIILVLLKVRKNFFDFIKFKKVKNVILVYSKH
jgi:hypothetical protein